MPSRHVTIANRLGLHARAAGKFVQLAGRYESRIHVVKGHQRVDAKSILGLLALAASQGTALTLEAEGADADAALEALTELIDGHFGESVD